MSLKNLAALLFIVLGALFGPALRAEELNVHFKTTPRSELLRPFVDPTDLSLLITGTDGRPVEQGTVSIRLDAPRPGRFFSTDYPLVEGTVLSEMELPLWQGRANWKQLFPIRGEYRLTVDVVSGDGTRASKAFTFDVRESQKKWLALVAFSAGLFLLGFVAGRVFTGARADTALAILGMTLLAGAAGVSAAQQRDASGTAVLEIEPATVGETSGVRWRLATDGVGNRREATLTLTITQLEKQKVVFAVEKIAVPGEWSMKFHFPDGGGYRVAAVGNVPGLAPVRNERAIAVTGVEPPASAMVPALAFFIVLIAAGLGVGRWTKRRSAGLI
ncbi:MAG: hypothetical protein ACREQ2_27995 [Candidatus Binatia bacterium]